MRSRRLLWARLTSWLAFCITLNCVLLAAIEFYTAGYTSPEVAKDFRYITLALVSLLGLVVKLDHPSKRKKRDALKRKKRKK
jgi:hypothetical protein